MRLQCNLARREILTWCRLTTTIYLTFSLKSWPVSFQVDVHLRWSSWAEDRVYRTGQKPAGRLAKNRRIESEPHLLPMCSRYRRKSCREEREAPSSSGSCWHHRCQPWGAKPDGRRHSYRKKGSLLN
jgi:hypothetical protein